MNNISFFTAHPFTVKITGTNKPVALLKSDITTTLALTAAGTLFNPLIGLGTFLCVNYRYRNNFLKTLLDEKSDKVGQKRFEIPQPKEKNISKRTIACLDRLDDKLKTKHLKRGAAVDNGDCFYDAFAQALKKEIKLDVSSQRLRQIVAAEAKYFATHCSGDNWIKAKLKGDAHCTFDQFTANVGRSFSDKDPQASIWGRPDIDGEILCTYFKVNMQVHGVGVYEDEPEKMSDPNNFYEDNTGSYSRKIYQHAIHIGAIPGHYVPVFPDNKSSVTSTLLKISRAINGTEIERAVNRIELVYSLIYGAIVGIIGLGALWFSASPLLLGSALAGTFIFAAYVKYLKNCIDSNDQWLSYLKSLAAGSMPNMNEVLAKGLDNLKVIRKCGRWNYNNGLQFTQSQDSKSKNFQFRPIEKFQPAYGYLIDVFNNKKPCDLRTKAAKFLLKIGNSYDADEVAIVDSLSKNPKLEPKDKEERHIKLLQKFVTFKDPVV